jgi:poly-gamma-glutamate synthesis protein (capsule biosynthesis protein)
MLNLEPSLSAAGDLPLLAANRDPNKLTVVVMTGVTALVRATAVRMEEKGMTYPDQDIRDWLRSADITHISNEISFSPDCPDPKVDPYPLIFCSKPEYMELLDDVGVDVVDMTGNHQVDWAGTRCCIQSKSTRNVTWPIMRLARKWKKPEMRSFWNIMVLNSRLWAAIRPAGIYLGSRRFAGVANCDYDYITQRIKELKDQGYQVIFTFQNLKPTVTGRKF